MTHLEFQLNQIQFLDIITQLIFHELKRTQHRDLKNLCFSGDYLLTDMDNCQNGKAYVLVEQLNLLMKDFQNFAIMQRMKRNFEKSISITFRLYNFYVFTHHPH